MLRPLAVAACFAVALSSARLATAQANLVQPRITAPIDSSSRVTLAGSRTPRTAAALDTGPVSPSLPLEGISLVFSRSAAQQAALDALVAAQQNPASPLYHQWLMPQQYAAQFGVAETDIAAAEAWLQQQGFTIETVSNSRTRITFSGTAAQVAAAFGAELHNYTSPATSTRTAATHYAPSADLTLPSALASVVTSVENLSSFRPRSHVKLHAATAAPRFTSSQTGENLLTPGDVDTIYDITPATSAGYTGTGQTIIVVGQSAIATADLSNFQTAAGLTAKLPTLVLMPGTGTSTINPGGSSDEDEVESDIDLEYSNAIAQGATIDFIYTGSNTNYGAFNALQYAVDNKATYPASIISTSYGSCEPALGATEYQSLNAVLEQAASQGQTVISAAGDDGSTDCDGEYSASDTTGNEQIAVDFPASSQYVTGMGGTEFLLADVAPGSPYFDTESSSDVISSAKSYIPEQVWNDDAGLLSLGSKTPVSSGGGGISIYTARPSWQTGVTNIPSGDYRLVPDISLYASPGEPDVSANTVYGGFLYCSSDAVATDVTGSCAHGFRDTNDAYLTVAGGTSFDAPIFAGMLAIINQAKGYTAASGQGVVNPTLYTLASNSTTYASAFHDITTGGNQCAAGTKYCGTGSQTTDYPAGTGYDEASGLGSLDLYNLLTAWPGTLITTTPTLAASTTTLSAATLTPASGASDVITITVASDASGVTATPGGSLTVSVDGTTETSSLAVANGSATYTFSSTTAGSHVITATYSGDTNYAASTGSVTVTVAAATSTTPESFSLAATNVTVSQGGSGTSTVTITPAGGYAGTVDFTIAAATSALNTDACYSITNTPVTGTAAVTTTLTIYTSSSSCTNVSAVAGMGRKHLFTHPSPTASLPSTPNAPFTPHALITLSGLLAVCFFGSRRSSRIRLLALTLVLITVGGALSGCGSGSSTATSPSGDAPAGTYSLTVAGTDSANSALTASAGLTLTIQ